MVFRWKQRNGVKREGSIPFLAAMKILHISDWHGDFLFPKEDYDIVISSGDMLPTFDRFDKTYEIAAQKQWVKDNVHNFKKLCGGRYFLDCGGNHDFISLSKELKKYWSNAIDLTPNNLGHDGYVWLENISFHGFPWVPYINGEWNFELMEDELRSRTIKFLNKLVGKTVLVMHCPPYGILDYSPFSGHIGNTPLTNHLFYGMKKEYLPKVILCGHQHDDHGLQGKGGILISNAATTYNIINI